MIENKPVAFISHSSADRTAVEELALVLARAGVDPWYAGWEIGPGDSIVDKINEGLGSCGAFVIVVSRNSVRSRWVREELNSAVVERIERQAQIVPVRLDDSPVPPIINHLRYVELYPLEENLAELVKAIYGVTDKPTVGEAPEYVRRASERQQAAIEGLTPEASAVLRHLVLEIGLRGQIPSRALGETLGLDATEIEDGLEELEELDLVKTLGAMRSAVIPKAAAWLYMSEEDLGFDLWKDMLTVARCVAGHEQVDTDKLEIDTQMPQRRINIAALVLQHLEVVKLIQPLGRRTYDFTEAWATRHTRRWLRENSF